MEIFHFKCSCYRESTIPDLQRNKVEKKIQIKVIILLLLLHKFFTNIFFKMINLVWFTTNCISFYVEAAMA